MTVRYTRLFMQWGCYLLLSICLLAGHSADAQTGLLWLKRDITSDHPTMGSSETEQVRGVSKDSLGNVYVVTTYNDVTTGRRQNIGLYKYKANGDVVWKNKIESKGNTGGRSGCRPDFFCDCDCFLCCTGLPAEINLEVASDVAVGTTGIYIAFHVPITADTLFLYSVDAFGSAVPKVPNATPAASIALNTTTSLSNNIQIPQYKAGYMVAKYGFDGTLIWQTRAWTTEIWSKVRITDIEVDNSDNVYIAGQFPAKTNLMLAQTASAASYTKTNLDTNSNVSEYYRQVRATASGTGSRFGNVVSNENEYGQLPFIASYASDGMYRWLMAAELDTTSYKMCNSYCNTAPYESVYSQESPSTACPQASCASGSAPTNYESSAPYPYYVSKGYSNAISVDGANIYWGGAYQDTIKYMRLHYSYGYTARRPMNIPPFSTTGREFDAFLLKGNTADPYSGSGMIWMKYMARHGVQEVTDVLAENGNLYVMLESRGKKFNNGTNPPYDNGEIAWGNAGIDRSHTASVHVAQLIDNIDINMSPVWYQRLDPSYTLPDNSAITGGRADALSLDSTGTSLYIAGEYFGKIDVLERGIDPVNGNLSAALPDVLTSSTTTNTKDIWFGLINANDGQYQWLKSIGGSNSDKFASIEAIGKNLIVGGGFLSTADFEPSNSNERLLSSFGDLDGFIAEYGCPTVTLRIDTVAYCENVPINLYANISCETNNCQYSYTWIDQNGGTLTTAGNQLTFIGSVGSNTRTVIVRDNNTGCVSKDSINFLVASTPSVSLSPTTALVCDGASVVFSAASPNTSATYSWYLNGQRIPLVSGAAYTAFEAGAYRVEVTDPTGCKAQASASFNKHQPVYPYVLPDTGRLCGGSVNLQVVNCPGCGYAWTSPLGSSSSSTTNGIRADVVGSYRVNITDNNGCLYAIDAPVIPDTVLVPAIWAEDANDPAVLTTTICDGMPVLLRTNACDGCSFVWSDGSTANFAFALQPGTYAVSVTNHLTGCTGRSIDINVDSSTVASPIITATPGTVCGSSSSVLAVSNPCSNCNYTWYQNTPSTLITIPSVGYQATITSPNPYGYYAVVVDTVKKCKATSNIITVASGVASQPIISKTSSYLCGGTPPVLSTLNCQGCAFQWFYDQDTSAATTVAPIIGATNAQYTVVDTGIYYVRVAYANGCVLNSVSTTIKKDSFVPTVTVAGGVPYVCNSQSVTLNSSGLPVPLWSYQWYRNNAVVAGATGNTLVTNQPGFYRVVATREDGCAGYSDTVNILASSRTSNLAIVAEPQAICTFDTARVIISSPNCSNCSYQWYSNATSLSGERNDTLIVTASRTNSVLYAEVTDTTTGCRNTTAFIQVRDTALPTPGLVAISNPTCSSTPVILNTASQAGVTYYWINASDTTANTVSVQNTFRVDSIGGNYAVRTRQGNCLSNLSNQIPVSFANFNALISAPTSTAVCNGDSVRLTVTPTNLNIYRYNWYLDNQVIPGTRSDTVYNAKSAGSYRVEVVDTVSGCRANTLSIPISNISLGAQIQSSTASINLDTTNLDTSYLCGNIGQTLLTVRSCSNCSYRWYRNGSFTGVTDTVYSNAIGVSAQAVYVAQVSSFGCIVKDTIYLDTVPDFMDTVVVAPSHANICNGVPVTLTETQAAQSRRWYLNGNPISGILAVQPSYQTNVAGTYHLVSYNNYGCKAISNSINVVSSVPATGFALNLNATTPIQISAPPVNLDSFLAPPSIRNGRGVYTALTASAAIDTANNRFTPSIAGAGMHILTYHDTVGACVFDVSDTIEVLQQASVDVVNRRLTQVFGLASPQFEACLRDSLRFIVNNFPFVPNTIQFLTDTGYRSVTITPSLTMYGSVYNGYIPVNVPSNARTGKVRLVNGANVYQTSFFLVVQNPTVSMNLAGVTQPLCSNMDSVRLVGTPVTGATGAGSFYAAYLATPSVTEFGIVRYGGSAIRLDSIAGYDVNGRQDLRLTYSFKPFYTGTSVACPDSVISTFDVEVRNVDLDSVQYAPIAITETVESMRNLTRMVFPITSRTFTSQYAGTYINHDSILPSTISSGWGVQPVSYTVTNSTCQNTLVDTISIWKRPTLDSITDYVCRRSNDTVFIGRDSISLFVRQYGILKRFDTLYRYLPNTVSGTGFGYFETFNKMSIASSNGGLFPINNAQGNELYAFVPSAIAGNSTSLSLVFNYQRITNYFYPTTTTDTVTYQIAHVAKTIMFEDVPAVYINPAIIADPVFCFENKFHQFSGVPNAAPTGTPNGQFYLINGALRDTLQNNLFNPTIDTFSAAVPNSVNNYTLRYVYKGNACIDSATTTISVIRPFSITLTTVSGDTFCQEEPAVPVQIVSNIQLPNRLDTTSGQFYVGGVLAGQVFSPSLRGAGVYPVTYTISDIYGCEAVDSSVFIVEPTPTLALGFAPTLPPYICANDTLHGINLFYNTNNITSAYAGNTITLRGRGVVNGGTNLTTAGAAPYYHALRTTSGRRDTTVRDTIVYSLRDTNGCVNTVSQTVTVRQLPQLSLALQGGELVPNRVCEGDSMRIVGLPVGGVFSNVSTIPTGFPFSLNAANGEFLPQIAGATPDSIAEAYLYTYADNATGCRDTIRDTVTIRNRADVTVIMPSVLCASDTTVNIQYSSSPSPSITSGYFTTTAPLAIRNLSTVPLIRAEFYPDSAGVYNTPTTFPIVFSYVSNGCQSTASTSILINPLPILSFTPPGSLLTTGTDTRHHICESAPASILTARNQGIPIFPETGHFYGRGTDTVGGVFVYRPRLAVFGVDTIRYVYTDSRGCTNTYKDVVVVDTVPALGFAGFQPSKQISTNPDSFAYCANDAHEVIVPSPFGGFLYFQRQLQTSGVFNFAPDSLATVPATTYELMYNYVSQRYVSGAVCQDSIKTYVEVRPTPVLQFVNAPTTFCVNESTRPTALQASPQGGIFRDITQGAAGGIVADSLFDPLAQMGIRTVTYSYFDTLTGCGDTIFQNISVYRIPSVHFVTNGGCINDSILFVPSPTQLSNTLPARDSITFYAWSYGDGTMDTVYPSRLAATIPNRRHVYTTPGIYFPTLTIVNRGQCDTTYMRRVVISPKVAVNDTLPYVQNFEAPSTDWLQETIEDSISTPSDSLWEWGLATGSRITTAFTQNHVWVTHANGAYQAGERGSIYSPCFDISTLERPMVAFDIWKDTYEGIDGAVFEYMHPTRGWVVLGSPGHGINWYDSTFLVSAPGIQADSALVTVPRGWSGENLDGFVSARYRLDTDQRNGDLRGMRSARFRLSFAASDNTNPGVHEGFAFDNFFIGNRKQNVLVEHFSNQNVYRLDTVENRLYRRLFSNLYGRDVVLLQYQTPIGGEDAYYDQYMEGPNSRTGLYGVDEFTLAKRVFVNGSGVIGLTDSLANNWGNSQEYLDMAMLGDALFKITIPTVPQIFQTTTGSSTGTGSGSVIVEALKDINTESMMLYIAITEDSLRSTQNHYMKSVVRAMLPYPSGTPLQPQGAVTAGTTWTENFTWEFSTTVSRRANLRVVAFVQNPITREVFQVGTSRDLTIFEGPVNVNELANKDGKEILGVQVYPNPAQDYFTVSFDKELEGQYEWQLVDLLGRVIQQGNTQTGIKQFDINTTDLASSVYVFSIYNGKVYTQRQVIIAKP